MHPKDADGIANSVDPDQTASSEAVLSWSALFAETYLSQYIEFVRYPKILTVKLLAVVTSEILNMNILLFLSVRNFRSLYHTYNI